MARMGFLRRTLSGSHSCFRVSQAIYHGPLRQRFLALYHNGSADGPSAVRESYDFESGQRLRKRQLVRYAASDAPHEAQLHGLRSTPTVKSLKNELDALKSALAR